MATWFQKFGSWIKDNFHKDTRRDDGLGRFLNGIDSFWNRITGSGLTGAEIEANQFSAQQAELAFEREAEFYEKNQSVKAQITQQQEAGINPFSINGSVSSGPSVSSATPSSVSPGSTTFDPLAFAMQIARFKMEQRIADAQINKTNAETNQIDKQVSWYDNITSVRLDEMRSNIKKNEASVNESLQNIKESVSRVSVNDSTVEINGARIQLMGSQMELNATQSVVNKLNASQMEKLMPYIQARQEAEIAYTKALSDTQKYAAEKEMYDANMSMLSVMRESDLISLGYYDTLVESAEWESKGKRRDYKWKPVNDICSNVSKIAVGVGSALSGAASLMGVPSVQPPVAAPASLTFF